MTNSANLARNGCLFSTQQSEQNHQCKITPADVKTYIRDGAGSLGNESLVEFIGGAGDHTCTLPGGRPIYVDGPGNECSTLKGDHNGFGTSDSQLVKCARAAMKGVVAHATIDGHPITNFGKLITATGAYPIRITKNRFPGITARTGRDAAYGYGLLVIGLTKGTHTLYHRSSFGTSAFTLHVR